jgi:TM2 domain-containing membrane protein YozV
LIINTSTQMSFNYSQLDEETENVYPQIMNSQPKLQQQQPLPYYPQQQQQQNFVQPNFVQQNVQQQFTQPQNPVQQSYSFQPVQQPVINPITMQQSSWVTPACSEPLIVLLCNFIMPGLGQILLGQVKKGLFMMIFYMICNTVIILIASFTGIGIILIPLLFIHWGVILLDGQILADRAKRGIPIMQGECATPWAKIGLSTFLAPDPVFSNTKLEECPQEWISKMQSFCVSN